ncbi:MAG: ABC transporter ATP-binding protein [Gemmatimonadaceae bacterium]|nr:ABC transporter ATP-binding protein [Gemmatimonadaceae bacterium]
MRAEAPLAIAAELLTRQFGDFTAVDAITFDVRQGEVFGFLGANGAGKTTAMRMLIGLLAPTSGRATVAGVDVVHDPDGVRQRIGYMSQRFSLYDDLTVQENIALFGAIYGLDERSIAARAEPLLRRIGLLDSQRDLVRRLPLGWRQQLSFSVALLHAPQVLFLDEPTGGVDPITRRVFWELIYETAAAGTTVLVTTHYLDEAEYCDRLTIMVDGRIAVAGTPATVKDTLGVESLDAAFLQLTRPAACD